MEVKLNIENRKDDVVVRDSMTLKLVIGTSAICGSYINNYDVKRKDDVWIVPKKTIIKRIKVLEIRKSKIDNYLNVMNQIINSSKCSKKEK